MTNLLIRLFIKDYNNITDSKVRETYGKFAGIVGIASNFILFLIKIAVGMLFGSVAITADAVNNLSDSGSSLVTLMGFKISAKPADEKHPYGHARMEYISGLIVAFIILILGFQLIQTSIDKIINKKIVQFSLLSIIVLVISIAIKFWQYLFFKKIGSMINSTTLVATSIDSRNDIISTSAVLTGAIVTLLTGYDLDGYMGVAIALFIMISGIKLVMDTISPLLGVAPKKELVDKIYKKILSYEGIIGLHDLTVHSYGPGQYFASVHCEVPAEQDIMVSHDIADNIERDFLKNEGINLVIHLDPIVTDDSRTNELKKKVEGLIKQISSEISIHDFRAVWGVSHVNLIFDVVVPFDFKLSDDELVELISDRISEINENYYSVITVDHNYVPKS